MKWFKRWIRKNIIKIIEDNLKEASYIKYYLGNINDSLDKINNSIEDKNNSKNQNINNCHPVWIMNNKNDTLTLASHIQLSDRFIIVNGVPFHQYDNQEEALKEMDSIISWLSSKNIYGNGIYELTEGE